jgi:hypothetical protein
MAGFDPRRSVVTVGFLECKLWLIDYQIERG